MIKQGTLPIYAGLIWMLLFAAMSFYWAAGGRVGVKSVGGEISHKVLNGEQDIIAIVWLTGFGKLGGAIILLLMLKKWRHVKINKILSSLTIVAGVFMLLYGLVNFITISLAGLHVLEFDLSPFALKWRLIFWEPFWMAGGVLYLMAGINVRQIKLKRD
ncbi:DUF3995 domain-containing protein [Halobacillus sp. B23F22_1]|uniref:DUF3995 domain-containing protein n=1 Tax=Halobacillus sp. B23F22_1 TaxID=3459514 RepID=UPI00373E3A8B